MEFAGSHSHFEEIYLEQDLISRKNLPAESGLFNPGEIHQFFLRFRRGVQKQKTAGLGHRFDNQHTRHDGLVGEVPLKKRLTDRNILDGTQRFTGLHVKNPINEEEGVPVRKDFPNCVDIKKVFGGDLRLVLFLQNLLLVLFLDIFHDLHISGVSGPSSNNMPLDGHSEESQISDHVQRLVSNRFILEPQLHAVEDAVRPYVYVFLNVEQRPQPINLFGIDLFVDDDDGVVKSTTLNESRFSEGYW